MDRCLSRARRVGVQGRQSEALVTFLQPKLHVSHDGLCRPSISAEAHERFGTVIHRLWDHVRTGPLQSDGYVASDLEPLELIDGLFCCPDHLTVLCLPCSRGRRESSAPGLTRPAEPPANKAQPHQPGERRRHFTVPRNNAPCDLTPVSPCGSMDSTCLPGRLKAPKGSAPSTACVRALDSW